MRNPVVETIWRVAHVAIPVLAIALLLSFPTASGLAEASQRFDKPEKTIRYFLDCVKAEDYDCALEACAIDEIANGFDYEAMLKWLRAMVPTAQYLPSEYGLFATRNRHAVEYLIMQQLCWMTLSVVLPEEYAGFLEMHVLLDTEVAFDTVVTAMDPQRFLNLEIVEIGASRLLDSERNLRNLTWQAETHGANAATSRAVLYELAGQYFVGGFQLLEYNGNWLIASLSDTLIGQPAIGVLIKVKSPAEYREMLDS